MEDAVYLIFNRDKVDSMRKTRPTGLRRGEYAVKVNVTVDESHFETPMPEFDVDVADGDVVEPDVGVTVESDDGEPVVRSPGDHVADLRERLLSGEELVGLEEWEYHTLVAHLEQEGWEFDAGLEPVEGERKAVRVIRLT